MAEIHLLDSNTIDKIAAGEVVERPSSVVKELVENAIDAGATGVTVEAKDGGIEFLRVTDNGCGISEDQIRKAFLRHATSKIEDASDLSRIRSLGFRGEALSSIAAVSKVELITKTADSITGNRVEMEGGVEKSFGEVGAPDGTTFLMRSLFFNTPVRRKFLKQPATEGGYIADLMEHLALSRPDISFKLMLNNQLRFHTLGNGNLKEAIYRIYGKEIAENIVPIHTEWNGIVIDGYLGNPSLVRSNRNFEIYFINGRFIKSNIIAKSLEEGYKEYLMQHKFPFCVLHISMEQDRVDVNVHPTKMDVRFSNGEEFYRFLSQSVRDNLKNREMISEALLDSSKELKKEVQEEQRQIRKEQTPEPFEFKRNEYYRVEETQSYQKKVPAKDNGVFENKTVWNKNAFQTDESTKINEIDHSTTKVDQIKEDQVFFIDELPPLPQNTVNNVTKTAEQKVELKSVEPAFEQEPKQTSVPTIVPSIAQPIAQPNEKTKQMNLFDEKILTVSNRSRFRIIGQVFETYWLIEFENKLLMIDQHAAHEKVKYERFMKRYHEKQILTQNLLPPVIVTLSAGEELVLKENWDQFAALGFEVESFGGNEYALRAVPVDLYGCSEREMFLEVLDYLEEGIKWGTVKAIDEKIASMSCKAAVKGNNLLSIQEAEELIDELLTLDNPYNCPHGRPTIVTISKSEMERKFKRIVN